MILNYNAPAPYEIGDNEISIFDVAMWHIGPGGNSD